jgi:hypothetical protein
MRPLDAVAVAFAADPRGLYRQRLYRAPPFANNLLTPLDQSAAVYFFGVGGGAVGRFRNNSGYT